MNNFYNIGKNYESNCSFIGTHGDEPVGDGSVDALITLFSRAAELFKSAKLRAVLRVLATIICLVAFVGIIGGVEAGAISLGIGILLSMLILFVEILCFVPRKNS